MDVVKTLLAEYPDVDAKVVIGELPFKCLRMRDADPTGGQARISSE